jgi:glycosyltransferase involved in cell wall biosynthesis
MYKNIDDKKLRILQVYKDFHPNSGGGGVARHIDGLSKSLCDSGHSVTVLAPNPESVSVPYKTVAFKFFGVPNLLRKHDVVHLHGARSILTAFLALLCVISSRPYLYTPHCYYDALPWTFKWVAKYVWDKVIERFIVVRSSATILLADPWRDYFRDRKIELDKVHIIPNCVYRGDLEAREFELINYADNQTKETINTSISLITVGRLVEVKRVDDIIKAVSSLSRSDIKLHIVGTGNALKGLENLASSEGAVDVVYFHGYLSDSQVLELLSSCDAFVIASEMEGLPTVIIEMILLRIPVICSEIPGNMAICQKVGIQSTFKVGDTEALASEIERSKTLYISDDQYLQCERHFTWEARSTDVQRLYYAATEY